MRQEDMRFLKMGLHTDEQVGATLRWNVTRVPGGWIYQDIHVKEAVVFVPLSDEFKLPFEQL